MFRNAFYQMQPEQGIDEFRYWVSTNLHKHEMMLAFFNIINENLIVREGMRVIFDSIKTNKMLYLPMLAPEFTLTESKSYDSMTDEKFNEIKSMSNQESISGNATLIEDESHFYSNLHVQVRLLYNAELSAESNEDIDFAIIHFHGGGFVSQDSSMHQNYTRRWAIELGVPVFSVDYRLAPQHPYPLPINDCY